VDHTQEDLAKFGYLSERKVDFFWETTLYTDDMQQPMF
jgi:hypothetical protein